MIYARYLSHAFFTNLILESFKLAWWEAYFHWHYMRYKQADQYFEDLPDMVGCYCMGGEL